MQSIDKTTVHELTRQLERTEDEKLLGMRSQRSRLAAGALVEVGEGT